MTHAMAIIGGNILPVGLNTYYRRSWKAAHAINLSGDRQPANYLIIVVLDGTANVFAN